MTVRRLLLAAAIVLLLAPGAAAAARPRPVPAGFVGVTVDGPALDPSFNLAGETKLMAASGVETVRMEFSWDQAQPYPSWAAVPADHRASFVDEGGVPTTFAALDRLVTLAANRRLTVLPVVQYAPAWAARHPGVLASPPTSPGPYAAFAGALVRRYGSGGTFWSTHPAVHGLPIRAWQIWNEPDATYQWTDQPFQNDYVALLKAARLAIRTADPHATIMLAGLTNFSWQTLAAIYQVPGAKSAFDAVAANAYTGLPQGVITILGRVRTTMRRFGDATKPLLATELGWPATVGKLPAQYAFATTERGQAARIRALLPLLARHRRRLGLRAFYLYTWLGSETPGGSVFAYAGLRRLTATGRVESKPAFSAFRRAARALEAR